MSPLILLALAFASIILVGGLMVLVNDLIEKGVRHLQAAERRPLRRRQRRPRSRLLA